MSVRGGGGAMSVGGGICHPSGVFVIRRRSIKEVYKIKYIIIVFLS